VRQNSTLQLTLFGPTTVTDGTQNLVGALRTAMGICGVRTIKEMHGVEIVVAPAVKSEGKQLQLLQGHP
jgi:IMP dehydrogenase